MMNRIRATRRGVALLEILLILAVVALLVQLWTLFGSQVLYALDVRNWTRTVWFAMNLGVLLILVGIRFGPDLLIEWRERKQRISTVRSRADKALQKKEERETLERMKQSKSRRIY